MRLRIRNGFVIFLLWAGIVAAAPQTGKKEFMFRGTVEKVDANNRKLTVNGENTPGFMAAMIMTYGVDKTTKLTMKPGDQIEAKVYSGELTLYDVRVVGRTDANKLPDLSYVCNLPGQEGVLEDKPGNCPQSSVPLTPIRLVTAYSCLKVQTTPQENRGVCPVDHSELVPITAALYFTCANDSKVRELERGTCSDGSARIKTFERRAHGDHNPRHGGLFFMDNDNWHHLEGAFERPNVFRVYFYDDFTRPLSVAGFTAIAARTDGSTISLKPGRTKDRSTLEAPVPNTKLPVSFVLRVKFKADDKERLFNFTFDSYSKEPTGTPAAPPTPQPAVAAAPVGADGLPTTAPALLAELSSRAQNVKTLLDKGDLSAVWYSAIGAKDVALALEQNHIEELPESQRPKLVSAVRRLTMAAWQIDAAGDLGDKEKLTHIYTDFSAAVTDIRGIYGRR
jgi:Cu/Ag efflux protein CusF